MKVWMCKAKRRKRKQTDANAKLCITLSRNVQIALNSVNKAHWKRNDLVLLVLESNTYKSGRVVVPHCFGISKSWRGKIKIRHKENIEFNANHANLCQSVCSEYMNESMFTNTPNHIINNTKHLAVNHTGAACQSHLYWWILYGLSKAPGLSRLRNGQTWLPRHFRAKCFNVNTYK